MPTFGEVAQLITAIAALSSFRNARKIDAVHKLADGMKTQLVDEVRTASLAKGNIIGREEVAHEAGALKSERQRSGAMTAIGLPSPWLV